MIDEYMSVFDCDPDMDNIKKILAMSVIANEPKSGLLMMMETLDNSKIREKTELELDIKRSNSYQKFKDENIRLKNYYLHKTEKVDEKYTYMLRFPSVSFSMNDNNTEAFCLFLQWKKMGKQYIVSWGFDHPSLF